MKRTISRKLMVTLLGITVGMFGFGYAMVPLYDVFCDVLGIRLGGDGTGRIEASAADGLQSVAERYITVQFDTSVDRNLPWDFAPDEQNIAVRVGEPVDTTFFARNRSDRAITGHAVPSIAPSHASPYMAKTECFCFERQQLAAGESQHMPVRFIIDPEIPDNIRILTLSYRFYPSDEMALNYQELTEKVSHGNSDI